MEVRRFAPRFVRARMREVSTLASGRGDFVATSTWKRKRGNFFGLNQPCLIAILCISCTPVGACSVPAFEQVPTLEFFQDELGALKSQVSVRRLCWCLLVFRRVT